jgi:hypothetical protein
LLRLDDGTGVPVELGWVISIAETQRAGYWLFFFHVHRGRIPWGRAGVYGRG